jgi:hypothetical protein
MSQLHDKLINGNWIDAIVTVLTNGNDPTLSVIVPTAIYGTVLLSLFIYSSSVAMPVVVAIILGGVLLAAFPSGAATVVVIATLFVLAAGGQVLTWRMGR